MGVRNPVRDGNTATVTMNFKTNHDKVTGTIGSSAGELEISDGEIEGSRLSCTVSRDRNGTKFDSHYEGTVEDDIIHFTVTLPVELLSSNSGEI